MRSRSTHLLRSSADKSFTTMRRLLVENARLIRICAQSKDMAKRYELLLREGDHRIKNSLQVVASLLGSQERREESPVAREALRAATARIQAVARIHDALQLNGSKDEVNLGALIATMCESLHAMAGEPKAIAIVVDAEPIQASLKLAQPVVLAVNELVLNALRHAFPELQSGAVLVTMRRVGGQLHIVVADDGVGLPPDYSEGCGYGMKLVKIMVSQAGGTFSAESNAGARFTLSMPLSSPATARPPRRFETQSSGRQQAIA